MAAALPSGRQGRILAVGLLVLAAVVVWLGLAAPLMDFYDVQAAKLAQRAALAQRMAMLAAELPDLRTRAAVSLLIARAGVSTRLCPFGADGARPLSQSCATSRGGHPEPRTAPPVPRGSARD